MSTEKLAADMGANIYAKPLEDACIRWGIIDGYDKARFLAQLYFESAGFKRVEENLRYSANRLLEVFKGRNGMTTLAQAQAITGGGPESVANAMYGGAWGEKNLGNVKRGDGWRFRGRGLIQTTGRANYRRASIEMFGDERLLDDPDMLLIPDVAAGSAACYWHSRRCNGITDIEVLTRKINGGTHGLTERKYWTQVAYGLVDAQVSR